MGEKRQKNKKEKLNSSKYFIEVDNVDAYDYEKTKRKVDDVFSKYRAYKQKKEIIMKRYNAALSLDNLGIFSNQTSDPVCNKVEQSEKYTNYIDTIDKVYELYQKDLSKDEKIVYKKCMLAKHTDDELMEDLCMSHGSCFVRKRSCYIKVALWFDLEVYK